MNTIEFVVLMIAIVIIVIMLCATWLTAHKSNPEIFNTSANLWVEKMEKYLDKYMVVIDIFPDGKIEYFVGTAKENGNAKPL